MMETKFTDRQVRDFVRAVKREAGLAWSMLGARFQEALIAERALYVLGGQHSETIPTNECNALVRTMLAEAGLGNQEAVQ